ncbi:Restriction endonuclease fold toxin 5 [Litoreibacter ascidiaceicola]|uniref:Restriction endonuclease fold toxin 5 n=1 Tax=Litoreibacter ascidiaceicola TaxID=1486859 RepID=A0A1M4VZM6_9RHOB|nr:Tox-REase-5 domain-containing protein [Litoreibacter ascidiaceicola]SHE74407.1 Restriction endonuclease fold toxin 5 [Litoreibacter ascidiaceicola]
MAGPAAARCIEVPLPGAILEICVGPPPPAPDLPPVEFPEIGPDLPPVDLPDVDAGPDTGADIEAQSSADTRTEICTEGCVDCIAAQAGTIFQRTYSTTQRTQVLGYRYQNRVIRAKGVGQFFPHDPATGTIFEWIYAGVKFDGLVPHICRLLEAKWGHDSWFRDAFSEGGRPTIRDQFIENVLMPKIFEEAVRHYGVVRPVHPDVTLVWVFSEVVFKIFMYEFFIGPLTPGDMSLVIETQIL